MFFNLFASHGRVQHCSLLRKNLLILSPVLWVSRKGDGSRLSPQYLVSPDFHDQRESFWLFTLTYIYFSLPFQFKSFVTRIKCWRQNPLPVVMSYKMSKSQGSDPQNHKTKWKYNIYPLQPSMHSRLTMLLGAIQKKKKTSWHQLMIIIKEAITP